MKVAAVIPGGPMDKAGVRAGDVLEAAGELPLTGMPDWFVARAHFERERPIDLKIRRDEQALQLHLVITDPAFRAWNRAQHHSVLALLLVRLILLSLAIFLAFSRSGQHPSSRIAGLMLAVGAVAEGYPSAGWAAALSHLPESRKRVKLFARTAGAGCEHRRAALGPKTMGTTRVLWRPRRAEATEGSSSGGCA